ncbi:MAG: DUF167 family protein [Candidatus Pacebacteria bacterium]|nr:DUF167 family protein [Candidatus Paceibacterota bacterium]
MLIHVKIKPDSKKDEVIMKNSASFIVSVREEAKENKANYAMLLLLAEHLDVPVSILRIVTGHHSPSKIIDVMGR